MELQPIWWCEESDGYLIDGHGHDEEALIAAAREQDAQEMRECDGYRIILGFGCRVPDDECGFLLHFHRTPRDERDVPLTRVVPADGFFEFDEDRWLVP